MLQSPKAEKKTSYQPHIAQPPLPAPPPPQIKWSIPDYSSTKQNDVSKNLEPSVYQKSTALHGNSKYELTKSYGLLVCRKSLESVYSPGRQWVNTQPR